MSSQVVSPKRHALGWPAGSIRALLAFGILAYLWTLAMVHDKEGKSILTQERASQAFIYLNVLMLLMLAHFFVAHGRSIGPAVSDRSPLGMPRGSARFLLMGGYLGLAYFTYRQNLSFQLPTTGPIFLMLAVLLTAFLTGHLLTDIVYRITSGDLPSWFLDIQAWIALVGMILLGLILLFRLVINLSVAPDRQVNLDIMEIALAGIVGFYFGARS
ncbi:MAG: hypothetical protein ACKO23_06100 [Gemmataceae bacterium]